MFKSFFYFITLLILFGCSQIGRNPASVPLHQLSVEELEKVLSQEVGDFIPRANAPHLYDYLDGIFNRLAESHIEMEGGKRFIVNRLSIVNSINPNAFVVHLERPGVSASENVVAVTTDLLRKMMEKSPGVPLEEDEWNLFESRLVGILSHELAHPLDDYDEQGFKDNHGKRIASQAREIRADSEGSLIAKKAGYSQSAVYDAISHLFSYKGYSHSAIEAALSTHPERLLRESSQRLLLTWSRYESGEETQLPQGHQVTREVIRDISDFFTSDLSDYKRPSSIHEAYQKLLSFADRSKSVEKATPSEIIEFNRLIMEAFSFVKSSQNLSDLSMENREAFESIVEKTILNGWKSGLKVFPKSQILNLIHSRQVKESFVDLPNVFESIKNWELFSSDSYHSLISKIWEKGKLNGQSIPDLIAKSSNIVAFWRVPEIFNSKEFLKGFHDRYGDIIRNHNFSYSFHLHFSSAVNPENQVYLTNLLFKNRYEKMSVLEIYKEFQARFAYGPKTNFLLPSFNVSASQDEIDFGNTGVFFNRNAFHAKGREFLQRSHREWMSFLWKNREALVYVDFQSGLGGIDWGYIWSSIDLDPKIGKSQLNQTIRKLTTSEKFVDYLDGIGKEIPGRLKGERYIDSRFYGKGLSDYLSGFNNPHLKDRPDLQLKAREIFLSGYLKRKDAPKNEIAKYLKKHLSSFRSTHFDDYETLKSTLIPLNEALLSGTGQRFDIDSTLLVLKKMADIGSEESKKALREIIFEKSSDLSFIRIDFANREEIKKIATFLIDESLIKDSLDFMRELSKSSRLTNFDIPNYKRILLLHTPITMDLFEKNQVVNQENSKALAKLLFDPGEQRDDLHIEEGQSKELRNLRYTFLKQIDRLSLSTQEKVEIFQIVTQHGASDETDKWFSTSLLSDLKKLNKNELNEISESLLERKSIGSHLLQVEIGKPLLRSHINHMAENGFDNKDVYEFIKRINTLIPSGSSQKDAIFEEIGWNLNLTNNALKALVEEQKTINWKTANPTAVNIGSIIANFVDGAKEDVIDEMIGFVLDPFNQEVPKKVEAKIFYSNFQMLIAKNSLNTNEGESLEEMKKEAEEITDKEILKMTLAIKDSSLSEKTTLIEMLMNGGSVPTKMRLLNLAKQFAEYREGTNEIKLLKAFINVIPEYERSVTIAYLLASRSESDAGGIKAMFEVFQTVGIKFGQLASIWNVFGDDITKQIEGLRDNASPMSKWEIEKALFKSYGERASDIKLKKVIGSASVKTVVEVELPNGKEAVLMVRRPNIEKQIKLNLKIATQFLQESKKQGLDIPDGMFQMIIDDLEGQLVDEIDFKKESKKMAKTKEIFSHFNRSLNDSDYRFFVPQVISDFEITDDIMIVEKAPGKTWMKFSKEVSSSDLNVKEQVGEKVFSFFMRTFTEFGFFNPDSHGGNVMVDPSSKTISVIDLGQVENFKITGAFTSDDRLLVAQFLNGLSQKDPEDVVLAMAKMSESNDFDRKEIVSLISKIINDRHISPDKMFVRIVTETADLGLRMKSRFSFGLIKGLIVLTGEDYISNQRIEKIMKEEFSKVGKRKLPAFLIDAYKDRGCMGLYKTLFSRR